MTLELDVDFENLTLEQIEDLETLDTLVDEIWNAFEAVDQIDDLADDLNDLWERIEAAGQDPEHLNGETYAELLVDITAMITDNLPIPSALQEAIQAAARVIGRIIERLRVGE